MTRKRKPNSIRRSTVMVNVVITWPGELADWDSLTPAVRNKLRDLMDEAADVLSRGLPRI